MKTYFGLFIAVVLCLVNFGICQGDRYIPHPLDQYNKPARLEPKQHTLPYYPHMPIYVPQYQVPEIPKFQIPEIPQYTIPEPPKFHIPEPPKFQIPELPKYTIPEQPKFQIPEQPKFQIPEPPVFTMPAPPKFPQQPFQWNNYHHGAPNYYAQPDFNRFMPDWLNAGPFNVHQPHGFPQFPQFPQFASPYSSQDWSEFFKNQYPWTADFPTQKQDSRGRPSKSVKSISEYDYNISGDDSESY